MSEHTKTPRTADGQTQPEPERPVPATEVRRGTGQPDKPSQAEGDRETVEEDLGEGPKRG